jgi:hypothetical protein
LDSAVSFGAPTSSRTASTELATATIRSPWGYPSAVSNITAWGQRNGKIHSQPQKGDIFTRKDGGHTGFVLSTRGSGFMTIEGNTSGPLGDV